MNEPLALRVVRLLAPLAARTALVEATPIRRSAAAGSRGGRIVARLTFMRRPAPIGEASAPLAA
jgi:hypothetical protein